MATFEIIRTARTPKECDHYPACTRGIQPGDRYIRATATPGDECNDGQHWWTLNICALHITDLSDRETGDEPA